MKIAKLNFLVSIIFFLVFANISYSYDRRALVIGNSNYSIGALKNTRNDAKDMKSALEELNFKTEILLDADIGSMESKIDSFCDKLSKEKTKIAFFYYSGHGVSIKDTNYLLPVSLKSLKSRANVERFSVSASWVVSRMEESGTKLNIMVLDSCRNTPTFSRTKSPQVNTGFSDMKCPKGTIIAFSSQNLAYDSIQPGDRNGVYTKYLKENIKRKGYTIDKIFNETGLQVIEATKNEDPQQVPSLSKTAIPDFYLAGKYKENENNSFSMPVDKPTNKEKDKREFKNSLGMKFVYIKPGTFTMGSPLSESGRYKHEKQHKVTLSKGFFMQTTEVTQGQWKSVMGNNPSYFKNCGDNCPVETVSWNDAKEFIRKLNSMDNKEQYRLPTEAEWEYAARGGSSLAYCFGNSSSRLGEYGWYWGNSGNETHEAAGKKANSYGLYDMHGNVYEWCEDRYADYPSGHVTDPAGPGSGTLRVFRGGSWVSLAGGCRSAGRNYNDAVSRDYFLGFRLVAIEAGR